MFPEINIQGRIISYYMIAVLIGVITVVLVSMKIAENSGHDYYRMLCTVMFSFIGVVFGGALLYAIVNYPEIIRFLSEMHTYRNIFDYIDGLRRIFSGTVFYGGMIGCIFMSYLFLRLSRKRFGPEPIAPYMDIGAVCIPLFHAFGRVGCFMSGCCYGIECKIGFAYRYSRNELANGPVRFPVQLCEAAFNLFLFFLLYRMFKKGMFKNKLMAFYLIVYPVGRFLLEFLRGDAYRGFIGPFSTSQFISMILITIAGIYLYVTRDSNKKIIEKSNE